jgi:hypothetical protein
MTEDRERKQKELTDFLNDILTVAKKHDFHFWKGLEFCRYEKVDNIMAARHYKITPNQFPEIKMEIN